MMSHDPAIGPAGGELPVSVPGQPTVEQLSAVYDIPVQLSAVARCHWFFRRIWAISASVVDILCYQVSSKRANR
mgnify:CR=1 FL=1